MEGAEQRIERLELYVQLLQKIIALSPVPSMSKEQEEEIEKLSASIEDYNARIKKFNSYR